MHQRALATYQGSVGNNHHRTADVCHKVAQHCLRRADYQKALVLVDQALKVWEIDRVAYLPEISRTSFLKAKILFARGDESRALALFKKASEGLDVLLSQKSKELNDLAELPQFRHDARRLRSLISLEPKEPSTLTERDFDHLLTFGLSNTTCIKIEDFGSL